MATTGKLSKPRRLKSTSSTSKVRASAQKSHNIQPVNKKQFLVVGIGASAGGLEALSKLLSKLPTDTGMAYVIIQHLDPTRESLSVEIFSRKTLMPVKEITNDMRVKVNHIYILPPNRNLSIMKGVLKLTPRIETRAPHMVIDFFFQSLALDQKSKAIGIVLSGTASDGTKGLEAIRSECGLTIAQDPASAKYGDMPRNAIVAGVVDLVLTPQQIARELRNFEHYLLLMRQEKGVVTSPKVPLKLEGEALNKIFIMLRSQSQVDFSHYKHTTLKRRIARRMILHKMEKLTEYVDYLQSSPQEVSALFNDFLINVTEFFRDPDVFMAMKKQAYPKIIKNKKANSPIRIWIVGCATGEEVYSVAISLLEYLDSVGQKTMIQIFATDISDTALQKARTGIYPESIQKNISKERLNRFFIKTENGYKIAKSIRDICVFSRHDIIIDPPFANIDLICCRNLLIYFDSTLQKHVLPILHYALKPEGFLCLGHSESVGKLTTLFRAIDKNKNIYSRSASTASSRLHLGVAGRMHALKKQYPIAEKPSQEARESLSLQHETEQFLITEYAPAGVVINDDMQIILASGDTAPYLKLPQGQLSLNFFKMVRQELVQDLRMMIQVAKKQNSRVKKENISIRDSRGHDLVLNLIVITIRAKTKEREGAFLILFESIPELQQARLSESEKVGRGSKRVTMREIVLKDSQIQTLKKQLVEARAYQESLAEDYEATQEAFTSVNEELQSTNEEFQSTNEELETTKEEIQSANEELTTLNDELVNSNTNLTKLHSDLLNLLGTVNIPIVMVGINNRLRLYTPTAGKLLNLSHADVGHLLVEDIKLNCKDIDLQAMVSEVIETITTKEQEIHTNEGRHFRLQVRPYKTTENTIDGAVISFVDITLLKRNLTESQNALEYATDVASTYKRNEKKLERSNTELEQFAFVASHDLKAPLRAVETLATWIRDDKTSKLSIQAKENLNLLFKRSHRLSNLIDGILQYSRIGFVDIDISKVDTRSLVKEVIDTLSPPKTFSISCAENLPVLKTQKVQLEQVFSNLISNSIKFHDSKSGHIEIGVKNAGKFYEFFVRDDGPGIAPKYHEKIFELFQTVQSRDKIESTGVGLSVVKKIVMLQHGKITMTSTPGEGTCVRFTWPKKSHLGS